jgi:PAS domain-containing protein
MLVGSTPFSRDATGRLTEMLCVATDVSPLKRAEQRVQESELALAGRIEVLEAILETAGEGILVADDSAQIIVANPLAREITSRQPGDSLAVEHNKTLVTRFFEPDGETPFDIEKLPLRKAIQGVASDNIEMMAKTPAFPDGIYLMTTGRPVLDREGIVRGGVVTLSDVTALRRAQHRLAELAITDELTRLPNRRALRDRLELLAAEAARGRKFSALQEGQRYVRSCDR